MSREQEEELESLRVDRYAVETAPGKRQVLLFDENELEREDTASMLRELGFHVDCVGELEPAVALYNRRHAMFDVLVIGLRGPAYATLTYLEDIAPIKIPVVLTLSRETKAADIGDVMARAISKGVNVYVEKPVSEERLDDRLTDLMERFSCAAKEFTKMVAISDPDFASKQAKRLVLEELARKKERRQSVSEGYVIEQQAAKAVEKVQVKETVDTMGRGGEMNKFALALKRSKAAHNAKMRVENASTLRRLESRYTVRTVDPLKKRGSVVLASMPELPPTSSSAVRARRRSTVVAGKVKKKGKEGGLLGHAGPPEPEPVPVPEPDPAGEALAAAAAADPSNRKAAMSSKLWRATASSIKSSNQETASASASATLTATSTSTSSRSRMSDGPNALTVIAKLAQKQTRHEGTLPLLMDHRGKLAYIQLPWELDRRKQTLAEYGRIPKVRVRDILQAEFREKVPTTKCATSGQRFLQKGYELRLKGDIHGAIRLYTRATLADQRSAAAFLCRGVAHHHLGDDTAALSDFVDCLRLDPKSTAARFNRALIFVNEGRDREALEELDHAELIDAEDDELFSFRAFVHRRCADFAEAQADYKRALQVRNLRMQREKEARLERLLRANEQRVTPLDVKEVLERVEAEKSESLGRTRDAAVVERRMLLDVNGDGRVDLAEFSAAAEFADSVYSTIFQRKSPVEVACSKPPGSRTRSDLDLIFHAAREIRLFRKMPQRFVRDMCSEVRLATALPGDMVVQQGAQSFNFFAILEGTVHVTVAMHDMEVRVHQMGKGEFFGENGLFNNGRRQVNIVVPADGETALIFVVPKALFFRTKMDEVVKEDRDECKNILRHCRVFNGMSDNAFNDLVKIARPVEYEHNTVILRQGESTSRFCILVSGICKTLKYADVGADLLNRQQTLQHQIEQFEMSYAVHHANKQDARTAARVKQACQLHEQRKQELHSLQAKLAALNKDSTAKPRKLLRTRTVYPGNLFGEEALLDPYYGREQYTVVADTFVTLLVIHREQLQTYKQSDKLLDKVRQKKLRM